VENREHYDLASLLTNFIDDDIRAFD